MRTFTLTAITVLLSSAGPVLADSSAPVLARVVALQTPAWIEHDGQREALRPGAAVRGGDRLETGSSGRVQIDLEDASAIQLGAQSLLDLRSLEITDNGSPTGLLNGGLSLTQGTLRFSGDPMRQRDIGLTLGDGTGLRLRDTDLWATAGPRDQVCLVQGSVEVTAGDAPAQTLDSAQPCLTAGNNAAQPAPISDTAFSRALAQTDLDGTQPALRAGGRFRVVLASVGTQAQAEREIARLSGLGYPLEALPQGTTGQTRYRLVIGGLNSHADATRYVQVLKQHLGVTAWVLVPG